MSEDLADAFSGRSVLVTGHTGFKGSWLTLWLKRLGAEVAGYSLPPPTSPNNFEVSKLREVLTAHYEADIRDGERLAAAVNETKPEIIFHLAAQALVRKSYVTPYETFDVNVMGTARLLEVVRTTRRPCVVIVITSDKCYENEGFDRGYEESDKLGGTDPYSASKGMAEILTFAYRHSFFDLDRIGEHGVKIATTRAGNVIGGGDWAEDRIIPDMVASLSANQPVLVRNPAAIRPWQHVLEPLSGYLLLAKRLLEPDGERFCSAWNFGPREGEETDVKTLVEKFLAVWGQGEWKDVSDPHQVHEDALLRLKIGKAERELGWRPRWNLEEAIKRTACWYRCFLRGEGDMQKVCLEDIAAYEHVRAEVQNDHWEERWDEGL